MISAKELANELGISPKTVYLLVGDELIPSYRVGRGRGLLRFDIEEVKAALKRRSQQELKPLPKASRRHLR